MSLYLLKKLLKKLQDSVLAYHARTTVEMSRDAGLPGT